MIKDNLNTTIADTVIGDTIADGGGPSLVGMTLDHDRDRLSDTLSASVSKTRTAHDNIVGGNFVKTADYMEGDRPFFVAIGKAGLIAALQQLDKQLRDVSA